MSFSPLSIAVVEDHHDLRDAMMDALRSRGHAVHGMDSAEAFIEWPGQAEVLVLDLNLPGEDGLHLSQRLRQSHPRLGIIMVTARGLPSERVAGYEAGADMYLIKPVALDELCGAVSSLARRMRVDQSQDALWLKVAAMQVGSDGRAPVALSAAQTTLLAAFCRAPDQRLESWQIIELLGQGDARDPKAATELQVVRLRKKLGAAGVEGASIQAIRGWGYQLAVKLSLK